ncbi:RES family NAD+ phosphorylase [Bacillus cereus]|nr:RES family NAD+ phosphorylase [Bacillus cereus]
MFCLSCIPLLEAYENFPFSFDPNEFIECEINDEKETLICEECECDIESGDFFIPSKDDLESINEYLAAQLGAELSRLIKSCSNCGHGSQLECLRASIYSTFNGPGEDPESMFDNWHVSSTLGDFLYEHSTIPYGCNDEVIEHIRCGNCRNGGGAYSKDTMYDDKFDQYTEIYTENDINLFNDRFYDESFEEAKQTLRLIDSEYDNEKLQDFLAEYIKNPLCISKHVLFKQLEEDLKEIWENQDKLFDLYSSKYIYRVQKVKNNNQINADRMWSPPDYVSSQGRYNMGGQSILYAGNNIDAIKLEVPITNSEAEVHYIAKFKLSKPRKCLPIDTIFSDFEPYIRDSSTGSIPENNQKKYAFTNIIQAICQDIGYEGIIYHSIKDSRYINYAIFNFEKDIDIKLISYWRSQI